MKHLRWTKQPQPPSFLADPESEAKQGEHNTGLGAPWIFPASGAGNGSEDAESLRRSAVQAQHLIIQPTLAVLAFYASKYACLYGLYV